MHTRGRSRLAADAEVGHPSWLSSGLLFLRREPPDAGATNPAARFEPPRHLHLHAGAGASLASCRVDLTPSRRTPGPLVFRRDCPESSRSRPATASIRPRASMTASRRADRSVTQACAEQFDVALEMFELWDSPLAELGVDLDEGANGREHRLHQSLAGPLVGIDCDAQQAG